MRSILRPGTASAVAVGANGQLVWSEGFGTISRKSNVLVGSDQAFFAYSLVKQITAVLTLQSAIRGEVNLSASVRRVLPDLPKSYEDVTLQQLLTHTAGVRHYRDPQEARLIHGCATAADALPLFVHDPLIGVPGEKESYSSFGYVLISAVLERATGLSFESLMAERIAKPAGLKNFELDGPHHAASSLAHYDITADGTWLETTALNNSCKMGAGGFLISAEDLVRFHLAVLDGRLVPLTAVKKLLGPRSELLAASSGSGGEGVSFASLESGLSVVILTNTSGAGQKEVLESARLLVTDVFSRQPGAP